MGELHIVSVPLLLFFHPTELIVTASIHANVLVFESRTSRNTAFNYPASAERNALVIDSGYPRLLFVFKRASPPVRSSWSPRSCAVGIRHSY